MIRTLSSFRYFADVKWLRPALLIPAVGEPVAFIFRSEVDEFMQKSCINEVVPYGGVDELIGNVSAAIRKGGYRKVGFDMSVERDSYELFFTMFRHFTPQAEIVDVHSDIMALRMVKDSTEIESIQKASEITDAGMGAAIGAIDTGASELDIAAEAAYVMMKKGAESPHVYVNAGKNPRLHAEPRRQTKVSSSDTVAITVSGDYNDYFSNESRTKLVGDLPVKAKQALEVCLEMNAAAVEHMKQGMSFDSVEQKIGEIVEKNNFHSFYAKGFAHGVGLLVEEDPITTILIPERRLTVKENMVLAAVHTPLCIPGIGDIKIEDTFLVKGDGLKKLTHYENAV